MLYELRVDDFTKDLASESPAPGGGAVAGLCASLSASLASMVFNLTIDRKCAKDYTEEVIKKLKEDREKAQELRLKFLKLMDEDKEVFDKLMDSYKMPKETEEEKTKRSEAIKKSSYEVLEVPEKLAMLTLEVYPILETGLKYGNINAISDVGVGAILADAAIKSAILNVNINTASFKDPIRKKEAEERAKRALSQSKIKSEEIVSQVNKKIYGQE